MLTQRFHSPQNISAKIHSFSNATRRRVSRQEPTENLLQEAVSSEGADLHKRFFEAKMRNVTEKKENIFGFSTVRELEFP